jgi:vacuolar-type H+-ATPase subunit I/STV1
MYLMEQEQDCGNLAENAGNSGWVTTSVAGKALGVTSRTVRNMINRGELVAKREGEGVETTYLVSISSLEDLRESRQYSGKIPRKDHSITAVGEELAEVIDNLAARLEARTYAEADLRARLELTEQAQSTLEETLARERERADKEREERQQAQEEANRLREELEAEQSKGFWRRLFGG